MTIDQTTRIEWTEVRRDEGLVLMVGERTGAEWTFWERDSWEVRWYPVESSRALIAKAEALRPIK